MVVGILGAQSLGLGDGEQTVVSGSKGERCEPSVRKRRLYVQSRC